MIVINELRATNLFGYKELDISFRQKKTTLVYGNNLTDVNVKSNGSGKSSIFDIISVLLTGEPTRADINSTDIIRDGEAKGWGEIILHDSVDNKTIHIEQEFFRSKTNRPYLSINGKIREDLKDLKPKNTYDEILSLLGLSKDDLFNYFLVSKEKYESFFKSKDSTKKEIINRFSNASMIDPVDDLIKKDIDALEKEIIPLREEKVRIETAISLFKEELQRYLDEDSDEVRKLKIDTFNQEIKTLEEEKENQLVEIKNINDKISSIKKDVKKNQTLLSARNKSLESLQKDMEVFNKKTQDISKQKRLLFEQTEQRVTDCRTKLKAVDSEIEQLTEQVPEYTALITDLEAQLREHIECPSCHHRFSLKGEELTYQEIQDTLTEARDSLNVLNDEIKALTEQRKPIMRRIASLREENLEKEAVLDKQLTQIKEESSSIVKSIEESSKEVATINSNIYKSEKTSLEHLSRTQSLTLKVEGIDNDIKQLNQRIEQELKPNKNKHLIEEVDTKIASKKLLLTQREVEIESKETEKTRKVLWRLNFKKFKTYLANTAITAIQERANEYLIKMGTNFQIMIDGYRTLSNGDLKEEITVMISRDGLEGEKPGKFSGGEKSKCDLALILAMRSLINDCALSGGLDFAFIDEILESNDDVALPHIVKGLSNLNQTVLMITHVNPDTMFQDCESLIVTKKNNVSIASYR